MAQKALQYIQELYKIERQAQCLTVKERRRLRQSRGKPKADEFHEWLIEHRTRIADNSARANAMDYSIKRW